MATLGRNIVYNVGGQGVLLVLSFVTTKFINVRLGADVLGVYYFSLALTGVGMAVVESGLTTILVREIATRSAAEPAYVRAIVRSASLLFWCAFAIIGIILWLSAPAIIDRWLDVRELGREPAILALRLFFLGAMLGLPRLVYGGVLRGYLRFGAANTINVGGTVAQQAGTLLLLVFTGDVVAFSAWTAVAAALALGVSVIVASRSIGLGALLPGFDRTAVRRNLRFASNTMVSTTASGLLSYSDRLSLGAFVPVDSLAHFGVASNLVTKARAFVTAAGNAAFPSLAEAHGKQDVRRLAAQYRKVDDALWLLGLLGSSAALFAVRALMRYIFDDHAAAAVLIPTALLCFGSALNATLVAPYQLSLVLGRPDLGARLNALALITIIPLTVVATWQLGMNGAGLAWVAYHVLAFVYFVPRVCRQCLQVSTWRWLASTGARLSTAVACYGAAWFFLVWEGTWSIPIVIASWSLGSALLVAAFVKLASNEFRAWAVGSFRSALGWSR